MHKRSLAAYPSFCNSRRIYTYAGICCGNQLIEIHLSVGVVCMHTFMPVVHVARTHAHGWWFAGTVSVSRTKAREALCEETRSIPTAKPECSCCLAQAPTCRAIASTVVIHAAWCVQRLVPIGTGGGTVPPEYFTPIHSTIALHLRAAIGRHSLCCACALCTSGRGRLFDWVYWSVSYTHLTLPTKRIV